jgi:hypothetical protein
MSAYCVVCRGPAEGVAENRRTIRFYLSAPSADRALAAAAEENADFHVLGIEPADKMLVTSHAA